MLDRVKGFALASAVASALLGASNLQAASVSYDLTVSNDLTGNIPSGPSYSYATVTIDNEGLAGLVNFTVTINASILTDNAGTNFGLQSFGFNVLTPGVATGLVAADIIGLPTNWSANVSLNPPQSGGTAQNGLGKFDVVVADGGTNRIDPSLSFSIDLGNDGSTTDDIFDYIAGSSLDNLFAAHITGFDDLNPLLPEDTGCVIDSEGNATPECNLLTSVYVTTAVPVPAAVWLFGSGLLGLVGMARRKRDRV
jgi:hypothetical protein